MKAKCDREDVDNKDVGRSSKLLRAELLVAHRLGFRLGHRHTVATDTDRCDMVTFTQIGRASCRERV